MNQDTEFGRELIASMREAAAILRGELEPGRVHLPSGAIDVRTIRARMGLSRPAFAERFGLAVAAVRDWEQGLRRPDPAARVLLMVIARNPEVVAETVAESISGVRGEIVATAGRRFEHAATTNGPPVAAVT